MYRIQFKFADIPFSPYYVFTIDQINSIMKKVNSKVVKLPFIPTKEMDIDLSTFDGIYGFTENEQEAVLDNPYYKVDEIIITASNIEVYLR